ncbi:hypothetical protein BS50DRAFT_650269 [Corynespora cassiicola Philippines]|uniref:C2H2-type domain-containing protein n=1 Tax=Corynespora cassiicola Philippines TaxID=1448308 RepID=A0A2T2MZC4_CORCC|nr:hypothetical protein BS50DRAFT_650269 [Corynespora cassiicola Philippines]
MTAQQQNPVPAYYRTLNTLHAGQAQHEPGRRQDESARENAGYRLAPSTTTYQNFANSLTTFAYRPSLFITPNDSKNLLQHVHSRQYHASNETEIAIQPNVNSENRSRISTVNRSNLPSSSTWQHFCSTCRQWFPSEEQLILHNVYHKLKWLCENSSNQPLEASDVTFEEPARPATQSTKGSPSFDLMTKKRRNSLDSSPIYGKKRKTVEKDDRGANSKAVDYDIQVVQEFSEHKEALVRNQEKAVRKGLVYTVEKATRMHIVGCLTGGSRMVCVHVVYPSITSKDLEAYDCLPICLVRKEDKILAALVLTSPMDCARLAMTTKLVDFGDLDEAYRPFIASYDI